MPRLLMPRTDIARSLLGLVLLLVTRQAAWAGLCPVPVTHPAPFMPTHGGHTIVHVLADKARAWRSGISVFTGHVVLTYGTETIKAHIIRFNRITNTFTAVGHVRVRNAQGGLLRAHYLHMNRTTGHGVAKSVHFVLPGTGARGRAVMVILRGRTKTALTNTRYTMCPEGTRVWYINAQTLHLNYAKDVGTATQAKVVFKGVPIFYWPYITFPISTKRKSGFLSPRYGVVGDSGIALLVPYYWNLAPNYDLTTTPELLTRRGVLFRNFFRYLGPNYSGFDHLDYIPADRLYGGSRYAVNVTHNQTFNSYWWGLVNYNKTSDPGFYSDFSTSLALASQIDLPQLGEVGYSGRQLRLRIFSSTYELLDTTLPDTSQPYEELPGATIDMRLGTKPNELHYHFRGSAIRFIGGGGPAANRLDLYPSISLPLRWPAGFVDPKIGLRETDYWFSGPSTNPSTGQSTIYRTVPVVSVKNGLFLDRTFAGGGYQSLEPELYYVYIPYRNQQGIPIFDTAPAEFDYTDLFRTNSFFGPDRIVDANQATAALTTRIYSATGRERLRASLGEVYYFHKPIIYLAPQTQTLNRTSDLAAEAYARLSSKWYVRGTLEWNPNNDHTDAGDAYVEYRPQANAIVTLGHRFVRGIQEEVDLSTQWPVLTHWSVLVETSYSLMESMSLESYLGLQYNSCCWGASFYVGQQLGLNNTQSTAAMFEFTLNGLGSLGTPPVAPLTDHGFMLGP